MEVKVSYGLKKISSHRKLPDPSFFQIAKRKWNIPSKTFLSRKEGKRGVMAAFHSAGGESRLKELDEKIVASIRRVFREVFGEVVATLLLSHLAEEGLLESPLDVRKLRVLLKSMFGEGSRSLEASFVEDLCRNLGIPVPEPPDFVKLVERLRISVGAGKGSH